MDEIQDVPKVFANRVIRQMVDHSFGDDLTLELKDYQVIRVAFAALGGNWQLLAMGALPHLEALKQVITYWGQNSQPKSKKQDFV